ncbi:DUF1365 domain-containing protein [Niveispirillum sp. KHB5.9]|uniref:DUF1365 domain-containing protein n=1 Tax=Niveispirillum sp. KHB5.9 TaxID=3400269 RepID=UPI003A835B38
MVTVPQLYTAKVMHKRLFPKENAFHYGVYYLVLPLPAAPVPGRLVRFHAADLGRRDGDDPTQWVQNILEDYGLNGITQSIALVTMPRVLGYVFNPVSFYLCLDLAGGLRAVLCEVHNTFGEQHSYLCAHPDRAPITAGDRLEAEKLFHVSPFLHRSGTYSFRFDLTADQLGIWIDHYDADGRKQLVTSLTGTFAPLTPARLRAAFWRHPLVALKAMALIHLQALKLVVKGIPHMSKPAQFPQRVTTTRSLCPTRNDGPLLRIVEQMPESELQRGIDNV